MLMRVILSLFAIFILSSCSMDESWRESPVYYSKTGFYQVKGIRLPANYALGRCIPANTAFQIMKINHRIVKKDEIIIYDVKRGRHYIIVNDDDYSGKNIDELRNSIFSENELNLNKYSPKVQQAIKSCEIIEGMTKEEVVTARGYPPIHETPNFNASVWKYWWSRSKAGLVKFSGDKVISIDGYVQPN